MAFVRSIGRWTLTALVVNAIVGSSIFGMPAELTRLLGRSSPIAMLIAALLMSLIVACMAEVGSQFKRAGGAYLYVRTAFGRFAGLQVGWFWILASMGGGAGCANLFVQYLARLWPAAGHGSARIAAITLLIAIPTLANYVGVRSGANLSNTLTVAKLLPLVAIIVFGLIRFCHNPHVMSASQFNHPSIGGWLKALLLLVFAYSGFENTLAPSAEVKNTRRYVPFALATGLAACAVVYALIQFVAVTTIGATPTDYPLADTASALFSYGALFVVLGVMVSTYGWLAGDILCSPRIVYSFAEKGDAPAFFTNIHSSFHTPSSAIIAYALLVWVLAVTGTFLWVAAIAGASSLILYIGVCASLIRLRHLQPEVDAFRVPFGPILAIVAITVALTLISALERSQALLIIITAAVATANWYWASRRDIRARFAQSIAASEP